MTEEIKNMLDLEAYIGEYVSHKIFDVALIGLKNAVSRINKSGDHIKLNSLNPEDCIGFVAKHLIEESNWATKVSFRDSLQAKTLESIFIDLDLYVSPVKLRIESTDKIDKIPSSTLLAASLENIILLGQPGAGKTTSVKKIFVELIQKKYETYKTFNFPLVIKLKDFNNLQPSKYIFLEVILNKLGFYIESITANSNRFNSIFEHIFKDFIERLSILLILDGFDEISNKDIKSEVVSNLRIISQSITNSKFILTSRSADYDVHIENGSEYELCSLTQEQVELFVKNWIVDESKPESNKTAAGLFEKLKQSPYWDATIRPLTLAHLCALQERNNSIPDRPKSIYKKIIHLLLEDWSNQRSIPRESNYAKFTVERKMDFLSRFAYELTIVVNDSKFDSNLLHQIYKQIAPEFDLPIEDSKHVVNEIESHSGLIIQTGHDSFEFAHKSLQEYLVSDFLAKQPEIIDEIEIIKLIPNEIAIMIAISSNSNLSLYKIIVEILGKEFLDQDFLRPFLSRLMIEKPDYKTDALFSITLVYMLNEIASLIYEVNKDHSITESELKQIKDYYMECAEMIMSHNKLEILAKSTDDLRVYYSVMPAEISDGARKSFLKRYGQTWLMKRKTKVFRSQTKKLEIPDNYILPGELFIDSIIN